MVIQIFLRIASSYTVYVIEGGLTFSEIFLEASAIIIWHDCINLGEHTG